MKFVIGTRNTNPTIYISSKVSSRGRKITETVGDAWAFDSEKEAQEAFEQMGLIAGIGDIFYVVKVVDDAEKAN